MPLINTKVTTEITKEKEEILKAETPEKAKKLGRKVKNFDAEIARIETLESNTILAFPTKEMRDAFYENFEDLIENCKELL